MKHRLAGVLIGAVCLYGLLGCGHVDPYLDIAREKGMSKEYLAVLGEWTRSQIVYSQFETKVHITATYQSPEFRKAYLDEQARIVQLRKDERKSWEENRAALDSELAEFLFYAYIPDKRSNDFDRQGSIWTVFLVSGEGEKVQPVEVRRIDPVTPVHTEFYPYINPYYGNAYRLRFPADVKKRVEAGALKLVFTGVIGKVELDFGHRR